MASDLSSIDIPYKCPICLEVLDYPVILDCGHTFCDDCITGYCKAWKEAGEPLGCPFCSAEIKDDDF